ncbi:unnamed protein product [Spirodela intermedia]|uniref:UBX domain-containing protein n=1 Tax=Spirodela intermedia TaxID=51605 RepID=A0A7I8IT47_SPIIN|nr:unnamed protein product [Spirodela intermedia]CAA6660124.1 unnamed protein product [Spirodela intermedia]
MEQSTLVDQRETTAAILTAALASKKLDSSSSILASSEKGNSSIVDTPSTSGGRLEENDKEPDGNNSSPDAIVEDEQSGSMENNTNDSGVASTVRQEEINLSDGSLASETTISTETRFANSNSELVRKSSEIATEMEGKGEQAMNRSAALQSAAKSDGDPPRTSKSIKLTDVHLNIRLPSGARLQLRSPLTDTLQSVKNYVDENAASSLGTYDLAIPYPRKIFMDQDMSLPLSELGFASREALIVVPHRHAAVAQRSHPAAYHPSGESEAHQGDNEGGYFALLKRILSFINPFSYLGGASHSAPELAPSALQQQGPAFQGNPSGAERSYRPYASNKGTPQAGSSSSTTRNQAPARAGSNIHTLRDVEGEDPSNDRNLFWNGNSTEFGGDDKN